MNLFVDMDGVLADFARHHEAVFGWRPEIGDNVDWAAVREVEDFYLNIPPMADLQLLWTRIERHQPIVLTGVPEIAEAPSSKRAWVCKHLGPEVPVRCCQASEKWRHGWRVEDERRLAFASQQATVRAAFL